jgi:hypothetical protein
MSTLPHDDRLALATAQERIAAMIASGAPLRETLEELVRIVEGMTPSGMIASILILDEDGRHLRHGAGPSLPAAYNAAIDGIEIGPEVGSCGTAAFHDKTVSVFDIANNPLWATSRTSRCSTDCAPAGRRPSTARTGKSSARSRTTTASSATRARSTAS